MIVKIARKVVSKLQRQLSEVFDTTVVRKARQMSEDVSHPLISECELLPSGHRFRGQAGMYTINLSFHMPYRL